MLLNEFGNGSRRPASEISNGVGDRYCFSARALIGTDSENAFDDGGRNAFSNAARPRFLWRLIDKPQFLADYGADDLRSLPIRNRFTSRKHIYFAEMSRPSERDKGDRGYVTRIDVRNFAVTRRRVDDALFDDVLGLSKKVLHKVVRPEHGPRHPRRLQFFLDLEVPSPDGGI